MHIIYYVVSYCNSFDWLFCFLVSFITDIVHSCVNCLVSSHFKAFSHLLRATKDPTEDFLDEQFQKAEEKIQSQFKMERIVYSQDHLYSNQLDTVKQSQTVLVQRQFISADVREMTQHLTAYFTVNIYASVHIPEDLGVFSL